MGRPLSDTIDYYANKAAVPSGTLVELFFDAVDRRPERAAYSVPAPSGARPLTYAQVRNRVRRGTAALAQHGIRRGSRVAILSENRVEWALADWMCLCAGAIDVPIYSTLPSAQVSYILRDSGASLVFVSNAQQLAKVREAVADLDRRVDIVVFDPGADAEAIAWEDFLARGKGATETFQSGAREAAPGDVATLIYTSGTTGTPKGVMLTHNNLASNIWAGSQVLGVGEDDTSLSFLPLCHVFQRMADYLLFASGCTVTHGTIDGVADDMKRLRPTVLVSVPRLYEKVHQKVLDADGIKGRLVSWAADVGRRAAGFRQKRQEMPTLLRWRHAVADRLVFSKIRQGVGGRLRYFVSGGAALAPEINRFFLGAGLTILEGYGLSETSPVATVNTLEHFRIGTVGRPVPGTEIRIAKDGEILIRGPQVMKGYYGLEKKTREVISQEGWFSSGDIGELSPDGYLTITDRKKDLIKTSGGKYVAPQAIENLLKKNPHVDQAVVVGDGRKFCSVLVVPAFDRLARWAGQAGASTVPAQDLLSDPRCQELLAKEIFGELRDLAPFETPKKIGLLTEPFTIENGALTPTQKVKRSVVAQRYANMIDAFYSPGSAERTIFLPPP